MARNLIANTTLPRRYAEAMQAVGKALQVPVIDLISRYIAYEVQNNCMDQHG
eukprot:COSAG02_NODE_59748_length_273_cov_0.810345_1_plen_51_part_01